MSNVSLLFTSAVFEPHVSPLVDIYDGEQEPMIFHGKTFTSKVPLREVCKVIAKYGFVASPYPIIISAEVHCSVLQQDMIAEIMVAEFKDSLVRVPPNGMPKIEVLPSPEDLKGKILLKVCFSLKVSFRTVMLNRFFERRRIYNFCDPTCWMATVVTIQSRHLQHPTLKHSLT